MEKSPELASLLGPSVLDATSQVVNKSAGAIINRVVLCGKLNKPTMHSKQEFGAMYQKFFQKLQADNQVITGVMLILPGTFIHLLESSAKVIEAYMRHLQDHETSSITILSQTRVLMSQGDVGSTRLFSFWSSRIVDMRVMETSKLESSKYSRMELEQVLTDTCMNMAVLGQRLSKLSNTDLKKAMEELYETYKNLIPRDDAVNEICLDARVLSIGEWISAHCEFSGVASPLESDLVWPPNEHLIV